MKYKNIIFDFGNVLAAFSEQQVLGSFCHSSEDFLLMKEAVFYDWDSMDSGRIDYATYMEHAKSKLPKRLHPNLEQFAKKWFLCLAPLLDTWDFIYDLKEKGFGLYILSNAPAVFADNASFYEITKEFDGIVFSGPLKMAKPEPQIYQYLFHTYHLNPAECLFLDDKEKNIEAGKLLGMDGIVFTGDILKVRNFME